MEIQRMKEARKLEIKLKVQRSKKTQREQSPEKQTTNVFAEAFKSRQRESLNKLDKQLNNQVKIAMSSMENVLKSAF